MRLSFLFSEEEAVSEVTQVPVIPQEYRSWAPNPGLTDFTPPSPPSSAHLMQQADFTSRETEVQEGERLAPGRMVSPGRRVTRNQVWVSLSRLFL